MSHTPSVEDLFTNHGDAIPTLKRAFREPQVPRIIACSGPQLRGAVGYKHYPYVLLGLDDHRNMTPVEGLPAVQRFIQYYGNLLDVPAYLVAKIDLDNPFEDAPHSEATMDVLLGIADHFQTDLTELVLRDVVCFSRDDLIDLLGPNVGIGSKIVETGLSGIDLLVVDLEPWGLKLTQSSSAAAPRDQELVSV